MHSLKNIEYRKQSFSYVNSAVLMNNSGKKCINVLLYIILFSLDITDIYNRHNSHDVGKQMGLQMPEFKFPVLG